MCIPAIRVRLLLLGLLFSLVMGTISHKLRDKRTSLLPIAYRLLCLSPVACLCLLLTAATTDHDRLSVYAPQTRYSLPVSTFDGHAYVGLFELLEPLAAPELKADGRKWKLRISDPKASGKTAEAEFQEGDTAARVRGKKIVLSAPARSEDGRLLLPLHGVGSVLMPLLGMDLIFHEAAGRMFLGGAAELISSEVHKGEPSTLALHFPEPVNPNISSEGNSLKLSFTRDPVISFSENQDLNDKLFSSCTFNESNGSATLTISGTAPLLAKFSDEGRTILISAAPAPPTVATVPAAPTTSTGESNQPGTDSSSVTASASAPAATSRPINQPPSFLVVIDPAHGGSDTGARITPSLMEKDITLSLARRLRQELQARHVASELLRDGDVDLALDQRAVLTNLARPSLFISLHAEPASTLHLYTPALPTIPDSTPDRGGFLLWQSAQNPFAGDSASLAAAVADSLSKRELTVLVSPAFAQPLHSIAAPAIAVEAPANKNGLKISQDLVASAIAEAVIVRKMSGGSSQ